MVLSSAKRLAKRIVKRLAFDVYLPHMYRKAAKAPVDSGKILFVDEQSPRLPDSFAQVDKYLQERTVFETSFIGLRQNATGFRSYLRTCTAMVEEAATARCIFLCDASDTVSCLPVRRETKVVQLWHACGTFKDQGAGRTDLVPRDLREEALRYSRHKNLSLVTVSSPEVVWSYVEAMSCEDRKEIVKPLGVSHTDVFFDQGFLDAARDAVYERVPLAHEKKVILYAPMFRGCIAQAEAPAVLDIDQMRTRLGDEYVLLIKHHPYVESLPAIPEACSEFAFQVTDDLSIDVLLSVADVCVSDYSPIVFAYSLFERPMVFFAYDIEENSDWRCFSCDCDGLIPGPVCRTSEEVIDYIESLVNGFDSSAIHAFKERFMSACDGHSTERICREVLGEGIDEFKRRSAREILGERNPQGVDVSVVVPSYNAMPELNHFLRSLRDQTYDHGRMEVIVVDDCSTDGTWEKVEAFADNYDGPCQVMRLNKNTGTPAVPRNEGLLRAQGTYIVFADADDWFAREAIERLLNHAVIWESDMMLFKLVGEGGRKVPESVFREGNRSRIDALQSNAMWTFAPLKLFKKDLIEGMTFPECMPEDIPFVLEAYLKADTVSVAADYDYYHVSPVEDGANASTTTWDNVESNLQTYRTVINLVKEKAPEGADLTLLKRRLMGRDVVSTLRSICAEDDVFAATHLNEMGALFGSWVESALKGGLPLTSAAVLASGLSGGLDELRAVVSAGCNIERCCSFSLADSVLSCSFCIGDTSFTFDYVEGNGVECVVQTVECVNSAMSMSGSCRLATLIPFADLSVSIVLDNLDLGEEYVIPCAFKDMASGDAECAFSWFYSLDLSEILNEITVHGSAAWRMVLRCESGRGYRAESLLGSRSVEAASNRFRRIRAESDTVDLSTYCTQFGNFRLRARVKNASKKG